MFSAGLGGALMKVFFFYSLLKWRYFQSDVQIQIKPLWYKVLYIYLTPPGGPSHPVHLLNPFQIVFSLAWPSFFKDGNPLNLHFVMFIPTIAGQGTMEQVYIVFVFVFNLYLYLNMYSQLNMYV